MSVEAAHGNSFVSCHGDHHGDTDQHGSDKPHCHCAITSNGTRFRQTLSQNPGQEHSPEAS